MAKFENSDTGKGSKEHLEFLEKKRKTNAIRLSLRDFSLEELNDRAEKLIAEYEKKPIKEIEMELRVIKEYLDNYLSHTNK